MSKLLDTIATVPLGTWYVAKNGDKYVGQRNNELVLTTKQSEALAFKTSKRIEDFLG